MTRDEEEKREHYLALLKRLDEELEQGHKWIESAPDSIIWAVIQTGGIPTGDGNMAATRDRDRVRLYDPVKEIIDSIDPSYSINSVKIHDFLLQKIPALEFEDQRKLKARIAATLGRLADEGFLRLTKKGSGSMPHVYQIVGSPHKPVMEAMKDG